MFDTVRDADFYLKGGIVKYKGEPVYIMRVMLEFVARIYRIRDQNVSEAPVRDLDLTPFPLGYFFDQPTQRSFYIERMPIRKWKVGLTSENMKFRNSVYAFPIPDPSLRLHNMIQPTYRPLKESFAIAAIGQVEMPFSRRFSVDYQRAVRYKTDVVGHYDGQNVKLDRKFHWLKEVLKEAL